MDINDLYKVIRAQIEHVDNTISQRIVWLVISQSFFFSGYAVLVTGSPADPGLAAKQHMLLLLFAISAMIMNIISLIDIICGMVYLNKLAADFTKKKTDNNTSISYPPIDGFKMLNGFKNLSALILPVAFLVIWMIVLIG